MRTKLKAPSETFESNAFARWLSHQSALLYSKIPIGDNTLTDEETGKLKAMGVRRGVPDFVMVHIVTGRILWVEMKRSNGGVTSKYQDAWLDALNIKATTIVTHGHVAAKRYVLDFYKEGTKL